MTLLSNCKAYIELAARINTRAASAGFVPVLAITAISLVVVVLSLFALLAVVQEDQPIIIGEPNGKNVPSVVAFPYGSERTDARVFNNPVQRESVRPKRVVEERLPEGEFSF